MKWLDSLPDDWDDLDHADPPRNTYETEAIGTEGVGVLYDPDNPDEFWMRAPAGDWIDFDPATDAR